MNDGGEWWIGAGIAVVGSLIWVGPAGTGVAAAIAIPLAWVVSRASEERRYLPAFPKALVLSLVAVGAATLVLG